MYPTRKEEFLLKWKSAIESAIYQEITGIALNFQRDVSGTCSSLSESSFSALL
jgi:hypothetical protein